MARAPRDPHLHPDQPGQRPLLQGHLRKGGRPAAAGAGTAASTDDTTNADDATATVATADTAGTARSPQPAEGTTAGAGAAEAVRGKTTKSPADVATRPHLEGTEQGPA